MPEVKEVYLRLIGKSKQGQSTLKSKTLRLERKTLGLSPLYNQTSILNKTQNLYEQPMDNMVSDLILGIPTDRCKNIVPVQVSNEVLPKRGLRSARTSAVFEASIIMPSSPMLELISINEHASFSVSEEQRTDNLQGVDTNSKRTTPTPASRPYSTYESMTPDSSEAAFMKQLASRKHLSPFLANSHTSRVTHTLRRKESNQV